MKMCLLPVLSIIPEVLQLRCSTHSNSPSGRQYLKHKRPQTRGSLRPSLRNPQLGNTCYVALVLWQLILLKVGHCSVSIFCFWRISGNRSKQRLLQKSNGKVAITEIMVECFVDERKFLNHLPQYKMKESSTFIKQ